MESDNAEIGTMAFTGKSPDPKSPFCSECLSTALELLDCLKAEASILRRFAGTELMTLIPRKEYLVSELKWKIEGAGEAGEDLFSAPDSFKALLEDIDKLNNSNGLFIKKSISYWQGLLSVFSPPSYDHAGNFARRLPRSPNGIAFRKKV
jgi:flagellar biosynthesis/type III secretory pathway chaperone